MKKHLILLIILCSFLTASAQNKTSNIYHDGWIDLNKNGKMDPYENPKLNIEKRIDNLISQMNLDEKTCQLATLYGFGYVLKDSLPTPEWKNEIWKDGIANIDEHLTNRGSDSFRKNTTTLAWPPEKHVKALNEVQKFFIEDTRLGVPVDFTCEGIRGLASEKATSFPAQLGLASAWDVDLITEVGTVTGNEARSLGYTNVYSPILDLPRDPRWGRIVECYSEDPFLTATLGVREVEALQAQGVISTPKHFTIYGIPDGGRDGHARAFPHATWQEVETLYLVPFREAFATADALGVMSSYNDYSGVPVSGSKLFLTDILRKEFGFKGYVVSDSDAAEYPFTKYHVVPDLKGAVKMVLEAGMNVRTTFNSPANFILPIRELVKEGSLSIKTVDSRVRDVLRVKFHLGLFDNPYIKNPEASNDSVRNAKHLAVSLKAARESIVLLKNADNILPLKKDIKKILVTGPNALTTQELMSRYGPYRVDVPTVLDGIKGAVPQGCEVVYSKGCDLVDEHFPESDIMRFPPSEKALSDINQAAEAAKGCDAAIVVVGETDQIVGESKSRLSLDLPGNQNDLVQAIQATGVPTIVILINGRPLSINWVNQNVPAILEAWFPGEFGPKAIADVLFGDYNPAGKLPITFPKSVGQIPMAFPVSRGAQGGGNVRVDGPLYPFGYGLSYTTFEYSDLKISPEKQTKDGKVKVTFNIKNTGSIKGDEIAELYVDDVVSSVVGYEKMLKGFKRVSLEPGETKQVEITLGPKELMLYNTQGKWVVEPGEFKVMIGASSTDIKLNGSFEIQ